MKREIWKPVVGYEGFYEISSMGRLRSVDRIIIDINGRASLLKGKLVVLTHSLDGYLKVLLSKNGKQRSFKIHRLVAMAFIPNPEGKKFVDHINAIRDDNRVENLRWVTAKENSRNPVTVENTRIATTKEFGSGWKIIEARNRNKSVHAEVPVLQLTTNGTVVGRYRSIASASEETGIDRTTIVGALNGRYRHAGGFLWEKE